MNDLRAKFECRKFRKSGDDRFSIKIEGYPDDMVDLAAMTIVTLAEQNDSDLGLILNLVKIKAILFNSSKQMISGKAFQINKVFMDEFLNNKKEEEAEDGRG
jgi:hypothetical protein